MFESNQQKAAGIPVANHFGRRETMIKSALYLSIIGLLSAPAMAENGQNRGVPSNVGSGSYKISEKHLDRVKWHESPREFQIIDIRPTIRDFREPDQGAQMIQFNLKPLGSVPGNTIIYSDGPSNSAASPFPTGSPMVNTGGLAPANSMFASNVPARSIAGGNLPDGSRIGHLAPGGAPQHQAKKAVSGSLNPGLQTAFSKPTALLGYQDTHSSAASSSGLSVRADASGKILPGSLIGRLSPSKK